MIVSLSVTPLSASQTQGRPGGHVPNRFIVSFDKDVANIPAVAAEIAAVRGVQVLNTFNYALKGMVIEIPGRSQAAILTALRKNPQVRDIAADHYVSLADTNPKGVRRVSAELGIGVRANSASNIDVTVMDTGIDFIHPDLAPNVDTGKSVDCLAAMPCVSGGQDAEGHGTNVASAVAAATNSDGSGIVGVAPAVNLISVRVFDASGSGTFSDVINGIDHVMSLNQTDLVEVINMSFVEICDPDCGDALYVMVHDAVKALVASGTTVIAAAGNDGIDVSLVVPARFPEVITVSAMADSDGLPGALGGQIRIMFQTYADDSFASFSNYGSGVDVIAPGVKELLAKLGGGTKENTGTSFSAPYVAGVAAIFIRDRLNRGEPTPLPATVRQALIETGECYESDGTAGTTFHGANGCQNTWPGDQDTSAEPLVRADNVDSFDPDSDGDGVVDSADNCPNDLNPLQENNDSDAEGDVCDDDDDNDGTPDTTDAFPLDSSEDTDTDSDGIGNNADTDDDGDGYSDDLEITVGTDPLDDLSTFLDVAGDINGDGQINAGDMVLGARILTGLYIPTVPEQARFDIAPLSGGLPLQDGNNNAGDYLILQRLVSGDISF